MRAATLAGRPRAVAAGRRPAGAGGTPGAGAAPDDAALRRGKRPVQRLDQRPGPGPRGLPFRRHRERALPLRRPAFQPPDRRAAGERRGGSVAHTARWPHLGGILGPGLPARRGPGAVGGGGARAGIRLRPPRGGAGRRPVAGARPPPASHPLPFRNRTRHPVRAAVPVGRGGGARSEPCGAVVGLRHRERRARRSLGRLRQAGLPAGRQRHRGGGRRVVRPARGSLECGALRPHRNPVAAQPAAHRLSAARLHPVQRDRFRRRARHLFP